MLDLPEFVKRRRVAVGVAALLAVVGRLLAPAPPPRTIEGVAELLGKSVDGHVRPGDFVWESPEGLWTETLFGRRLLFLGAEKPGAPRDVYRARVRVSLEGRPLSVSTVRNLTSSPLGDETGLAADGPHAERYAAFASTAYGAVTGATLLDLAGDGGVVGATSALDHWLGAVTNFQETGTLAGLGRTTVAIETPLPSTQMTLGKSELRLTFPDGKTRALDLATRALVGAEDDGPQVRAEAMPHLRKAPVLWAVDTVRAVTGPGLIAWLEDTFFGLRDKVRRAGHAAVGKQAKTVSSASDEASVPPSPPLDASAAGDDGGYWPPAKLPSIWESPEAGEGVWEPPPHTFLRPFPAPAGKKPPPYFFTTFIAPDPKRPYAKVLVVAMDMRQLDVNMEGGVEDPKSLTGMTSPGKIPRKPEVLSRVVGAFNGAFKTTHGAYGMMVDKRVLLPPRPEAATIILTEDKRVGMGSWGASDKIPSFVHSYRQNLDALVDDGKFNPTGRTVWGFQLAGHTVNTERSGICVTKPGHFLYLWGDDISGVVLGKAMIQAGCAYGMHLDMNPKHTGFVFASIREVGKHKDYDVKLLTREMEILPERFIEYSPKDFFYVTLRDTSGPEDKGGVKFAVDKGAQPSPEWIPAISEASLPSGGVEVSVLSIERDRVAFRVRPGRNEGAVEGMPDVERELAQDERNKVLAAFGLGNGRRPKPLGLSVEGKTYATARGKNGYLVVDEAGNLDVVLEEPAATAKPRAVVELPLLVAGGNTTMFAESLGTERLRGAVCMGPNGRVMIASTRASSDAPLAAALLKLSCKTALSLDRGGHDEIFVERAGVAAKHAARGEQTGLYAVAMPLHPRAFVWRP